MVFNLQAGQRPSFSSHIAASDITACSCWSHLFYFDKCPSLTPLKSEGVSALTLHVFALTSWLRISTAIFPGFTFFKIIRKVTFSEHSDLLFLCGFLISSLIRCIQSHYTFVCSFHTRCAQAPWEVLAFTFWNLLIEVFMGVL